MFTDRSLDHLIYDGMSIVRPTQEMPQMRIVRCGDEVMWRGGFGARAPQKAKIKKMELTEHPDEKYGSEVSEVTEEQIREGLVVFDLENGHWAYSSQIELI